MKNLYLWLLAASGLLSNTAVQGQHLFTDSNLSPYRQDFNTLSGGVVMAGRQVATLPEVYAEAEFGPGNAYNYVPGAFDANDGTTAAANYYHFGAASGPTASDRAFGGIGGFVTGTTSGIGYVGIRFRNSSSVTVKNLEVSYAMEQWYNSTYNTAAQVAVSYLMGPTMDRLIEGAGTWTNVPALTVAAPSTATTLGARDGNAATNRRLMSTTIPVDLAPNQEIMIRWTYALNANTNGNGLSIDDVVVTPETNVFYSGATGNVDNLANWHTQPDGGGSSPTSFAADNQTFYVMSVDGNAPSTDRIGGTIWTVSGANSKVVVGTETSPGALRVSFNKNIAALIDVSKGSYFLNQHTPGSYGNPAFTLGTLATTSTVEYTSNSTVHSIAPNQYSNLKIKGNNANRSLNQKVLAGNVVITGTLSIESGSNLVLGENNLTILSGGSILNTSATAFIVTDGTGCLRMQVPRASTSTTPGAKVAFPVGNSFTSYTPLTLQQTSTSSDDVFEVRVADGVAKTYDATTYAPGPTAVTREVVNKTWLISKEVVANPATVTMTLQWNGTDATADFDPLKAHINHYTAGAWDNYKLIMGATGSNPYVATRKGITSFSPFSVSSRENGALPVELVAFDARRTGATVATTWATASEKNNDHFTVERSANGTEFESLGTVWGAGNSSQLLRYTFEDKAPLTTKAYYRLRQTDIDGTKQYSPVVTVQASGAAVAARAVAVPNPSTGPFEVLALDADVQVIEVTNVLGARVAAPVAAGLRFDLSAQPAGLYLIRLQTPTGVQLVRVMKN